MPHTFLRQQRFFTFALLLASRHRVFCKSGLGSDNGPERRTPVPSRALPAVTSAMTRSAASLDELDCEPHQPNQCRRGSSEGGWHPSCFVPEAFIHLHSCCVRATCPGDYRIGTVSGEGRLRTPRSEPSIPSIQAKTFKGHALVSESAHVGSCCCCQPVSKGCKPATLSSATLPQMMQNQGAASPPCWRQGHAFP